MITVKYERYYNDYNNHDEVKIFENLDALSDWMFGLVKGEYKRNIWFCDPDSPSRYIGGELRLDFSCCKTFDGNYTYYISEIEDNGKIIYSTGRHTNGTAHWNETVKDWFRKNINRIENPTFNFG